ncbi:MAG: nucleotidyltransferase domain-containing protein [Nanoarchaeota archaeon]
MPYKQRIDGRKTSKLIKSMTKKIRDKYNPEKIILFGSYAYGRPKKDSDVDLLIIKRTNARHIDRSVKIREILKEENRFVAIEPLVYTPEEVNKRLKLEDDFIKTILEKGVILYG